MDVEYCSGTLVAIPCQGHTIDALLYHPAAPAEHRSNTPVVLRLHGLLGNLLDETEHFLPYRLAAAGYPSLTMNTLLANLGLFFGFGVFADTMGQIDAACEFLKQRGYPRIVIAGHGLGGCIAIRYATSSRGASHNSAIVGVIAIATPYSMPDMVRRRWRRFSSQPTYQEIHQRAERFVRPPPGATPAQDEIIVVHRAHGHSLRPEHTELYTLRTWWALASPEADEAKPYKHIGHIRVPVLSVQGTKDTVIEPRDGEDLRATARNARKYDVTQVFLDADHTFTGQHDALGQCVAAWLRETFAEH